MRHLWLVHVSGIPRHTDLHLCRNIYPTSWFILSVFFFVSREDVCSPYMCLGSAVTQTSTPVGTSTQPAGSFCLYCFSQPMRCLWSLYMSGITHHTDLHHIQNVFLIGWFILSVLFLRGGETSVVLTCFRDCTSVGLQLRRNIYLSSWFILSVLFLTGSDTSVLDTHVWVMHHTDLHHSRNA